MVAVGIGTGVGANVLAAKSLGMKDSERAGKAAGNAVFLAFVIYIVFLVFGILGTGTYIRAQTSNPVIAGMGTDILGYAVYFHLVCHFLQCMKNFFNLRDIRCVQQLLRLWVQLQI